MGKVFIIIWLALGLAQNAGALEINFKPAASVNDSVIRLGDLAAFDEQSEMTRALASLTVGQSPSPGEKTSLGSLSIKNYLVSSQSLPGNIRWTGSPTVAVTRLGLSIGPDRIQAIIAKYIDHNKSNLPEAEIRFIPSSLPLPFTLPTGDLTYEVIPSNPGVINSSRFSIIFRVDNKVVKNMSVRGKVEALASVVIAGQALRKGCILGPEHLSQTVLDISSINDPELDQTQLLGKRLRRSLRAGSPIQLSMVESLPVVHRGERVKIVITSGPLRITASGLAHSDGIVNQMIQVQNSSSNKMIHCRVAAPGLVEVML